MPGLWSLGVRAGAAAEVRVRSASLSAPDSLSSSACGGGCRCKTGPLSVSCGVSSQGHEELVLKGRMQQTVLIDVQTDLE